MIASPGGSSVSKRLAKRSILGTRVVAPGDDGKLYPGIIQAMKTCEDRLGQNRYSVKFDDTRRVKEFRETEIVGPGFQNVTSSKLRSGQIVYVTHCNREMQGAVVHHRPNIDQVIIQLLNGGPEVKKKLEEVRLLESRKSARLIGHGANTDFSKLADFNIVHERKRLNSETNSDISGARPNGFQWRHERFKETRACTCTRAPSQNYLQKHFFVLGMAMWTEEGTVGILLSLSIKLDGHLLVCKEGLIDTKKSTTY
ncbi:hypothetical protein TCAL_00188 [Tigriopus californicus]|uniref:DUF4772 domain-containing protein n=1 Tax=Tigriopus californicus TaxID=6832 RepID=A0A553P4X0_TIGCA|nr:hypothetical protein TCAL_00188 [Tigriopus californicus]|eukprot:TCALIF_00188-PA protein Name:"Similar to znf395 Zinc finger protein 395 (Xenopus laevis)" AED:0.15 eAED:0.36 QI:0/0/0/1/1/1/3/0/254